MQYNFPCERKIIILGHHLQKREMQNYSEFEVYLGLINLKACLPGMIRFQMVMEIELRCLRKESDIYSFGILMK